MRIPFIQNGGDDAPLEWWEWFFAPAIILLIFLAILGWAGLVLLASPLIIFTQSRQERQFVRRMREQGRYIPWQQLEPHLHAGEGNLVVEKAMMETDRVWWTQEDVAEFSPAPLPTEEELDCLWPDNSHPFVTWCFERYLHPDSGQTSLTIPFLPPGVVELSWLGEKFPNLKIVKTVKLR